MNIKDEVLKMLCDMPMAHSITPSKITLEYHGNVYNNALDCLSRHIETLVIRAVRDVDTKEPKR